MVVVFGLPTWPSNCVYMDGCLYLFVRMKHITVFLLSLAISGCSTFEIYDEYRIDNKGSSNFSYIDNDIKVDIGFMRENRFFSIGVLGFPIIPAYIKLKNYDEIKLIVEVRLDNEFDFSVLSHVCITFNPKDSICPDTLMVDARALYWSDKQPRWHHVPAFYGLNRRNLEIAVTQKTERITLERIYRHYRYNGNPKWGYLTIRFEFKYPCKETCPTNLLLNTSDLVFINAKSIVNDQLIFKKTRESDYEFTRMIQ